MLAQNLKIDPEYLEYFQQRSSQPDQTVILDNGAYEGQQLGTEKLLRVVELLRPQVVVLPDTPGGFRRTIFKGEAFFRELMQAKFSYQPQVMAVLHAEDGNLEQFVDAYKWASSIATWVGFSRLTKRYGTWGENELNRRALFAAELQRRGVWRLGVKHHALGMLQGRYAELHWLAKQGFQSCDSSAPVWRGLMGYKLEDSWPDIPLALGWSNLSYISNAQQLVQDNLQLVMEACGYADLGRASR